MTEEEVRQTIHTIGAMAQIVCDLPLAELINEINRTHSLQPIIDPTGWMQNHKQYDQWLDLATALQPFQKAVRDAERTHE